MAASQYTCGFCGVLFSPKEANRTTFCGRQCSFSMKAKVAKERAALRRFAARARSLSFPPCVICSAPSRTANGRFCSDRCAKRLKLVKACGSDSPVKCKACGVVFCRLPGTWNHGFCSVACHRLHNGTVTKAARRAAKARRRAVEHGADAERIDPLKVFERDGWRCHLCKKATPRRLRGTYNDRAPELDHVVSLADGGSHTWGNVACSCRSCNGAKGARSLGQLGLPMAA